jgi:hypothetical protein
VLVFYALGEYTLKKCMKSCDGEVFFVSLIMDGVNENVPSSTSTARQEWTDRFKSFMNLKIMLVAFAGISLIFLLTSIFLDTYISTYSGHPVKFDLLSVDVLLPDSRIGSSRISVSEVDYKYSNLAEGSGSSADDKSLEIFLSSDLKSSVGFQLPITTIQYASSAGTLVLVLDALSIVCTAMAIVLQLVFRAEPDSFILRPGVSAKVTISRKDMLRSGLPGFCLLASAAFSMMHAVLVSSYVHNFLYRLVAYAIFNSEADGAQLAALRVSLKGESVAAKQEQLRLMQFIGRYLTNTENVGFGISFFGIILSIALNLTVVFVLFYNDNAIARSKTNGVPTQALTNTSQAADSQWKALPWHCRVRPLWVSMLIFIFGLSFTAVGGNVARIRGVKMNRHPFEVEGAHQSFIDDVVISHTNEYFFSTAGIVDGAVMIFMPILLMVAISSLDRIKFASKVCELFGIIFFMRGISVMATIMPTLFNVLQHPQCWDKPGSSLADQITEKEFCNDLMFSGHTVFCFLPALIFVFSIVYGPYSYKPLLIASVLLSACALTSLIIVGRLHYTADVVVAIVLTALLVIMNAPVWKLQFSFRRSQLGFGSVSAIDKVPGFLELCIERLNVYAVTVQDSVAGTEAEEGMHDESWKKIDAEFAKLGELIEQVKLDSINAERAELAAIEDADDPSPPSDDMKQPLLSKV